MGSGKRKKINDFRKRQGPGSQGKGCFLDAEEEEAMALTPRRSLTDYGVPCVF